MARLSALKFVCVSALLLIIPSAASSSQSHHQQQHQEQSSTVTFLTARSLAISFLRRIVNLRHARGDDPGAERIKHFISTLENGFSFWKNAGSLGWDYLLHYSWRSLNPTKVIDILRGLNDIQAVVSEILQLQSDADRVQWISLNYGRVLRTAKSTLQNLLVLVDQPGALRNFVMSVQAEVVSGDILRDALQLSTQDLQSLIQVSKEMIQKYYGSSDPQNSEL